MVNGNSALPASLQFLENIDALKDTYKTNGNTWIKYGVTKEKALEKNSHIEQSSGLLWDFTKSMLADSKQKGGSCNRF